MFYIKKVFPFFLSLFLVLSQSSCKPKKRFKLTKRSAHHILYGDFYKDGRFRGGLHYIHEAIKKGYPLVIENIAPNGVIQGRLFGRFKTFFPKSFSKKEILRAVEYAANNGRIIGNKFYGEYKGVKITGYLDLKRGIIKTGFPKWPQ